MADRDVIVGIALEEGAIPSSISEVSAPAGTVSVRVVPETRDVLVASEATPTYGRLPKPARAAVGEDLAPERAGGAPARCPGEGGGARVV